MAESPWKSAELQLAKCITDGLSSQNWEGNLQTLIDEQQSWTNATPEFSPNYVKDNENYKKHLTVVVSFSSEVLDFQTQRCLEKYYELFICIGRQFKGCEELDDLLFLKEQIQDWVCGHCCDGFRFNSFSDERLIPYDSDLMTSGIFENFIPLQYSVIAKKPNLSEGI